LSLDKDLLFNYCPISYHSLIPYLRKSFNEFPNLD